MQAVWVLGQPPIERLFDELEEYGTGDAALDRAAWVAAWSRVNDQYIALERLEAGVANSGTHRPLDAAFADRATAVQAHPHYQETFRYLPTSLGMVELDRLVIYQMHVTRNHVERLMQTLGPQPGAQAIADCCLPLHAPAAPVKVQKLDGRRYLFSSPSSDLRFQEASLLPPELRQAHRGFGTVAGLLGLPVGFGCNFLNVIRVGNRCLLHNGYHRACALRALGITHVPCVIQTATREEEVRLATSTRVGDDPSFYFESARPPLLKDFFDERLSTLIDVKPTTRCVEIRFEVREYTAVDCA